DIYFCSSETLRQLLFGYWWMRHHGLIQSDTDIRACERRKNHEGAIDSRLRVLVVAKLLNLQDIASRGLKHGKVTPFQCRRLWTDEVWVNGTSGEHAADEDKRVYGSCKQNDAQPRPGDKHVESGSFKDCDNTERDGDTSTFGVAKA